MTGFMDADGSALVGGLNPSGGGQALQVDANGNLKTIVGSMASMDGLSSSIATAMYIYNGGAPGGNLDRLKSIQGKGPAAFNSIASGGGAGSTNITFIAAPTGLGPGQQIILVGGGGAEVVYTTASYVAGTNPVPIQTPIINAGRTGAYWDYNTALGPGLSGFLPIGVIPAANTIYDSYTGNYFLVRAATADAMAGANVPVVNSGVYNGSTIDRQLGLNGAGVTADLVRYYTSIGKAYTANIGLLTSGTGTNTYPLSIFNPGGSGKTILLYSLLVASASAVAAFVQNTTTNPAYGTAATVANSKVGGAASAIAASCTTTTTSQTVTAPYSLVAVAPAGMTELLTNQAAILLPAGSNNGVTIFLQTSASGNNSIIARWIEY